jgi:spore germination protein GerM
MLVARSQRRMLTLTGVAMLAAAVASCGVVGANGVERIAPPAPLLATLPTSTEPATSAAATSTSDAATTTVVVQTEPVRLYFIASGHLTYVATPLPSPVTLEQILAALQAGPPEGALGQGLRTAVPPANGSTDALHAENTNAGVAIVDLPRHFFDTIAVNDQRMVIAQIVLTLTDSRGIGQVQFSEVVTRPNGESVPAGSPLSKSDFVALLDSSTGANGTGSVTTTSMKVTSTT